MNRTYAIVMACLLCVAGSLPTLGWGQSAEVRAVLEPLVQEDTLWIRAYAANLAESNIGPLSYQLSANRIDERGNRSRSEYNGTFSLHPNERLLLVSQVVNLAGKPQVEAQLRIVNEQGELMAEEQLSLSPKTEEKTPVSNRQSERPTLGDRSAEDIEIDGIFILDNTRTRFGHEFYDLYYQLIGQLQIPGSYQLEVEEQPGRGLTTVIGLELNGNAIFQNPLPPRYEQIEQLAQYAAQLTLNYLQYYDEIQQNLENEEF